MLSILTIPLVRRGIQDQLPIALQPLQRLLCLRIIVPFASDNIHSRNVHWTHDHIARDLGGDFAPSAEMLRKLPEQLVEALPGLRYISLAVGPYVEAYLEDEYCDPFVTSYTWWRVVRLPPAAKGGLGRRKLVEMSEGEGLTVWQLFLEKTYEEISDGAK